METDDRFDCHWKMLLEAHASSMRYLQLAAKHLRAAKRYVFQFAKAYIVCTERFHNEVLAMVKSEGKNITDWMDELWGPIEAFSEDRRVIIAAIKAGMTEEEFVQQHSGGWQIQRYLQKQKRQEDALPERVPIPDEPDEAGTIEEKKERWRCRAVAMRAELDRLRAENRELKARLRHILHEIARVTSQNKKLMRALTETEPAGSPA